MAQHAGLQLHELGDVVFGNNRAVLLSHAAAAALDGWALGTALPGWHRRGIGRHEWAGKCARVNADEDFSGGFFVALFERIGFGEVPVRKQRSVRARRMPVLALRSFYGSSLLGIRK